MHAFSPALRRQRQRDLGGLEGNLIYIVSPKTASKCYAEKPCLEIINK